MLPPPLALCSLPGASSRAAESTRVSGVVESPGARGEPWIVPLRIAIVLVLPYCVSKYPRSASCSARTQSLISTLMPYLFSASCCTSLGIDMK
jgi:hypothetical protein